MSHWISKATNAFKGDDESSAQAFELFCECGQKHTGLRRAKWQRIVCRSCNGALFILQRDAYPAPKEKPEPVSKRAVVEDEIPVAEALEAEFEEAPRPTAPRRESLRPRPLATVDAPVKRALPPLVSAPSHAPRPAPGGFWKPFRVILVVVALLGGVTGFLMYQSSQRSAAERSLKDSIDKIKDALGRSEWVQARNQLEIALQSGERLGREDAAMKRYGQLLRETRAMTSLLSQPLGDVLAEAATAHATGEKELAAFQFKVKGQWVILEGLAEPVPGEKKNARVRYRISLPVGLGTDELPVDVMIVSAELSRRMAKAESESVVVAIQIEAIELNPDHSAWQIVAEPEATVLWAYRQTYLGIGYPPGDADLVANTLAQQAQHLGVTDDPKAE